MLQKGEKVLVGLSGGADSVALTLLLKDLGYKVICLHINHGIRGNEAERDQAFVENFCQKNGIRLFVERINVPSLAESEGLSIETCARNHRHKLLSEYAQRENCKIAIAHNKNDQAETMLMHLIRGCGLNGICGISAKNGKLIRPLLCISREEIENYLKEQNADYVTDSTNLICDCARNKLRIDVLQKLYEDFPDALDNIFESSQLFKQYNCYFASKAKECFDKFACIEDDAVFLTEFKADEIIVSETIRLCFEKLNGHKIDLEQKHINAVMALCDSGKKLDLPYQTKVCRIYDKLMFYKEEDAKTIKLDLSMGEFKFFDKTVCVSLTDKAEFQKNTEFLDFEKIPENAVIRNRRSGDFIAPMNMGGTCTLKKFFIDKKVPLNMRNKIPLVAVDNEIFAVLGFTVSEKVKLDNNTTKILMIQER